VPPSGRTRDLTHVEPVNQGVYNFPVILPHCGDPPCPTTNSSGSGCQKFFDKILSLSDYEESEILCPHCGSKNVEQGWSAFSAITSNKSA